MNVNLILNDLNYKINKPLLNGVRCIYIYIYMSLGHQGTRLSTKT